MNWNTWTRQLHRSMSVVFTLTVLAVIIAGAVLGDPAEWVFYLPLPPLFVLFLTGLYLYILPYAAKRRRGRETAS